MLPPDENRCHETGFKISCKKCVVEYKCVKWVQILGMHPQTGEQLAKWGCIDSLQHVLQLEQTRKVVEVGAAIESFRNETMKVQRAVAADNLAKVAHDGESRAVQPRIGGNNKGPTVALPSAGSLERREQRPVSGTSSREDEGA